MLSRIANSLFWMGRYLERAQHSARYVNVHFLSALDAPILSKKEFLLDSISAMTGLSYEYDDKGIGVKNEEMIFRVMLDDSNPVSIRSSIFSARENARGTRDILSFELWQSINEFYHEVNTYVGRDLTEDDIIAFTEMVVNNCAIVTGYIHHSLIHDETWSLIRMGMHAEAAAQVARILISKVKDILKAETDHLGKEVENYQCITLLKSVQAFDMSRIQYKAVPNLRDSLEFVILSKDFPRSILFNLNEVKKCLTKVSVSKIEEKGSAEFFAGKLNATFSYLTVEDIEKDVLNFLEKTLDDVYKLSELIDKKIS